VQDLGVEPTIYGIQIYIERHCNGIFSSFLRNIKKIIVGIFVFGLLALGMKHESLPSPTLTP
jgi:hypothetical protein